MIIQLFFLKPLKLPKIAIFANCYWLNSIIFGQLFNFVWVLSYTFPFKFDIFNYKYLEETSSTKITHDTTNGVTIAQNDKAFVISNLKIKNAYFSELSNPLLPRLKNLFMSIYYKKKCWSLRRHCLNYANIETCRPTTY